jgi:outer membrane murein-binding lipoprotein Lpp
MTLTRLVPALFAVALLAGPAFGQTADDVKKINDKLDKLTTELQQLRDGLKSDTVREKVTTVEAKIDQLDQDIQTLKKDLRDVKRKVEGGSTTALRPEFDSATRRGHVRLINDHADEMSVLVNNRSYRLLPGAERLIDVAPGEFTYQVLNIQRDPRVRTITADETRTIRIHPVP